MSGQLLCGAAIAVALLSGCKKSGDGPDCKGAAKTYARLVIEQVERDNTGDSERKARALSLVPSLKDRMISQCETKKWKPAVTRCMVEAKRQEDLQRCVPQPSAQPTPQPSQDD